jgi:hypothetical protein
VESQRHLDLASLTLGFRPVFPQSCGQSAEIMAIGLDHRIEGYERYKEDTSLCNMALTGCNGVRIHVGE